MRNINSKLLSLLLINCLLSYGVIMSDCAMIKLYDAHLTFNIKNILVHLSTF